MADLERGSRIIRKAGIEDNVEGGRGARPLYRSCKHRAWSTWASSFATFVFYFKICKGFIAQVVKNIYFHT